jgi:hypothetical protein
VIPLSAGQTVVNKPPSRRAFIEPIAIRMRFCGKGLGAISGVVKLLRTTLRPPTGKRDISIFYTPKLHEDVL